MTRFSMLSKLMQSNFPSNLDEQTERNATLSYFEQFKLYAIILCDPNDGTLIRYISQNFPMLDRRTGRNLLFFSLAEPGVTTEAFQMSVSPEEAMRDTEQYQVDEDIYTYVLSQALGISANDFPCILITNSLKKQNWYVVDTSAEHVCGDLMTLTSIANDTEFDFDCMIEDELNRIIHDAGRSWRECNGVLPLCELLAGIEAAVATHSCDRDKSKKALNTSREIEFWLKQKVGNRDVSDFYFLLRCLRKPPQRGSWRQYGSALPTSLSINPVGLENNTVSFLTVYDKIVSCYEENVLIDYSALCSLAHKIFESELNASMLQLMRFFRDIPMPKYYNRWYDNATNIKAYEVVTVSKSGHRHSISLNAHDEGNPKRYRSPGLGNTYYAFQFMCKSDKWNALCSKYGFDRGQIEEFTILWYKIFQLRNQEAHCTPMSYEKYQALSSYVNDVFRLFLDNLVMIKKSLKDKDCL